jgi:ergothioneine biosynthesis protein EgtC
MCRFAIYKGPEIPIHRFVLEPEHSILKQSYDAKEMLSGSVNADGFGIGWFNRKLDPGPALYTSTSAIWNDPNVPRLMKRISSELIFAHVRGASDGMPVTFSNTHPFVHENFLFMHNGAIDEFRKLIFPSITSKIKADLWDHLQGNTDSEHLFGLWLSALGRDRGNGIDLKMQVKALRETIGFLEKLAGEKNITMVLNLGISDGKNILATRYHFGNRKATLYYNERPKDFSGAMIIASEKMFEDSNWKLAPERSLIRVDEDHRLTIESF